MQPSTVEELRDAVTGTTGTLRIAGAGTGADWGASADTVIDTTRMTGVLRYSPADMTIAVRAGTPLTEIQGKVAEHGQRVAFDPARAARGATIGGLLATADAGPLRTGYGSLRNLVIGATVVLADGTVARSGGHVIKNVAGYDLAKLFHGSLGTLGVVAELVLRVHPLPRAETTVSVPCTPENGFAVANKIIAAGLEAAVLEWCSGPGRLLVRLEGTPEGVAERADAVCALADARVLTAEEADQEWAAVAAIGDPGATVLRVGTLPSAGPQALEMFLAAGASATSSVPVGVHTLRTSAPDELVPALHREFGAAVAVLHRGGLDPSKAWGPPPPAVRVMRAIKRQFDPDSRFPTWPDEEHVP
jgi:glycolate oxidase FAD binding subunit